MPSASNVSPAYVFHGTIFTCHKLCTFHVWGCPVYVLDPEISNSKNILRWKIKSRRDVFLGYIPNHSSDVYLVLKLTTGHISPQYHMVLDKTLRTVQSIYDDEDTPVLKNNVAIDLFNHQVPFEPGNSTILHYEWINTTEQEEKFRFMIMSYVRTDTKISQLQHRPYGGGDTWETVTPSLG